MRTPTVLGFLCVVMVATLEVSCVSPAPDPSRATIKGTDKQIGLLSHQQTYVISIDGNNAFADGGWGIASAPAGTHQFGIRYLSLAVQPPAEGVFEFSVEAGKSYRFEVAPSDSTHYQLQLIDKTTGIDAMVDTKYVEITPGNGTSSHTTTILVYHAKK
jgi:hypothetical protein